jgi:hypothetical protein
MYEDRQKSSCYDVEEFGLGMVRLPGGVTFMIEESWAMNAADGGGTSRVLGSKGGVQFSPFSYHTTISDMELNGTFELQSADTRWHPAPNFGLLRRAAAALGRRAAGAGAADRHRGHRADDDADQPGHLPLDEAGP